MKTTKKTSQPIDYARAAGREFAAQTIADPVNHQSGPGRFAKNDSLPDGDYTDMLRKFGGVTAEMEAAYRAGYNERAAQ